MFIAVSFCALAAVAAGLAFRRKRDNRPPAPRPSRDLEEWMAGYDR